MWKNHLNPNDLMALSLLKNVCANANKGLHNTEQHRGKGVAC